MKFIAYMLNICLLIQSASALVKDDQVASIHKRFMNTFKQMMDIEAIDSDYESHQLQFSGSPPYNDHERLAMAEMSDLKDQMHNHSLQDIKDAVSNRNGNYYVYNKTLWLNHSSGHILSDEQEAIIANRDLLLETLDNTYSKLVYPSKQKQGLEKRFLKGLKFGIKSAGKTSSRLRNSLKAVKQRLSRPFKQVSGDIQSGLNIINHPVVKRVRKARKFFKSSSSQALKNKKKSFFSFLNNPKKSKFSYINHPRVRRYFKLQRQQYSLNPKTRKAAKAELKRMRKYIKLTEKVLDTVGDIFKMNPK